MKVTLYIMLFFFMVSCLRSQNSSSIYYKRNIEDDFDKKPKLYSMSIPKGYRLITLIGGHNEIEKQYIYSDSAKIYVSDFEVSILNYHNIMLLGDIIAKKRFEVEELKVKLSNILAYKYKPELIFLQGKSSNGLYWRDIKNGYISIGYVNVSEKKKLQFDKILSSFSH